MGKSDKIDVQFDRADRTFRFGEAVTGKVVVEAAADFTYPDIEISYGWRTHGRGDPDRERETTLRLAGEFSLRKGDRREFPFQFKAPIGPVTYHGQKLNVDWYLTASATYGLKCEEDFVLLGAEPAGAVMAEQEMTPASSLQQPGPAFHAERSGWGTTEWSVTTVWAASVVMAIVWALLNGGPTWLWIYAGAATLIGIVVVIARPYELEVRGPIVEPDMVYPGGRVRCRLDIRARQEVYLQTIEASLISRERVSRAAGTSVVTETHELSGQSGGKTYGELLASGRVITFECTLPVEEDAPVSFSSAHNAVEWFIDMSVNLRSGARKKWHIPITVLAAGYVFSV